MSYICHRFILFLLRVSKSKYKLIEPIEPISVNYKSLDVIEVSSDVIFNDIGFGNYLDPRYPITSVPKDVIMTGLRYQLYNQLEKDGLLEYFETSTDIPLQTKLTYRVRVVKP